MKQSYRRRALGAFTGALMAISATAWATTGAEATSSFTYTKNMHPMGYSERSVPFTGPGSGLFNSDLAFWGDNAYQGTYEGFRILDVSAPANPVELNNFDDCVSGTSAGNQGDVIVWGDLLVRSWNSPAPSGGRFCGNLFTPQGQEGVHIFDVSDPQNPVGLAFVPIQCGSHTATGVPDLENNRLLVYNSASSGSCPHFDIVEVPLDDPASASIVRRVDSMHTCHDIGVILGDANRAACAGGAGARIFSLDEADGASLDNPVLMHHFEIPGVSIGHSAAWSWDGEVLIFGHEPGGGAGARCQSTSSVTDRTLFFFDHEGNELGRLVHPRPQTSTENCTWHNYNVIPTKHGRVLVAGNYQSGISVVDFTDPASPREIAYADPAPLLHPTDPNRIVLGGDWSTYWYNGFIYESDITRGLIIWNLSDKARAAALKLDHLNPQTQEFTIN